MIKLFENTLRGRKKYSNDTKVFIKNVSAFVVFIIFFSNSFLNLLYFEINRYQIREVVQQNFLLHLAKNQFVKIEVNQPNYTDNEIEVEDKMYDIFRQEFSGGKTILYCVEDNDETDLNQKIEKNLQENLSRNTSRKNMQLISFNKDKYFSTDKFSFYALPSSFLINHSTAQFDLIFRAIEVIFSPPKV